MMRQFWIFTLGDGRRAVIESGANPTRYDRFIGFGAVRAILAPKGI